MKSRVRVAIKRLLKYSILGVLCLFVEVILRSLDVLSILNCDIFYVTIKGSLNFGEYIVIKKKKQKKKKKVFKKYIIITYLDKEASCLFGIIDIFGRNSFFV